jgi:uncharacterized protein YndB with AHSA1/START domain
MKRHSLRAVALGILIAVLASPFAAQAEKSVAAHADARVLHKEITVPASLDEVWRAWTTAEGMAEWWVQDARIECAVLGTYELMLIPDAPEGERGSEGCRVLGYLPRAMFCFEWSFPPSIPALRSTGAKTQVVLRFDEPSPGAVRVRLDQLGWQEGPDWDKGYAYFDPAWTWVLKQLQAHFEQRSRRSESWIDGAVTVNAVYGPRRRQEYAVTIPAPRAQVWETLTTVDGVRAFLSPAPNIELTPGGAYALFPESTSRVLGFVPERQLVVSGSAPLEFPNVRMGGTWAVIDLADAGDGETAVTMTCLGWQTGEEWERAFDYFLKNNPVFLNLLRQRFTEGPLTWSDDDPPRFTRQPLE